MDWSAIGKRIRQQREYMGFTREQFAEQIDVTPKFCSDIELGVKGMDRSSEDSVTAREIALFSVLGGLTFTAKMAMAGLPSIEPVPLLVMLFAVTFGKRSPILSMCCRSSSCMG